MDIQYPQRLHFAARDVRASIEKRSGFVFLFMDPLLEEGNRCDLSCFEVETGDVQVWLTPLMYLVESPVARVVSTRKATIRVSKRRQMGSKGSSIMNEAVRPGYGRVQPWP